MLVWEEIVPSGGENEPDRVVGVVGQRERVDFQVAEREPVSGIENPPVEPFFQTGLCGFRREAVRKDPEATVLRETAQSGDVIAVFVPEIVHRLAATFEH